MYAEEKKLLISEAKSDREKVSTKISGLQFLMASFYFEFKFCVTVGFRGNPHVTSSLGDSLEVRSGGDVDTETASGPPLHLLLLLHAPVLEPDLHLALGEHQPLRQFPADGLGDVHRGQVDSLELGQLLFAVRATFLARRSRRRRRLERMCRVSNRLTHTATRRRRGLGAGRPRQRRSRANDVFA